MSSARPPTGSPGSPPLQTMYPLSSKRSSTLVLCVSLALIPLVVYFLEQPWSPAERQGTSAPHIALLASLWIFAVPLPYWGYRRSVVRGRLAVLMAFVLAVAVSFTVGGYIRTVTPALLDFYPYRSLSMNGVLVATMMASIAVLCSRAYRSLIEPRAESLGLLLTCAGLTLVVLWCACALFGSTWSNVLGGRVVLAVAVLLIAAGHVHMARRLGWLRAVVQRKVPGFYAEPIPADQSSGAPGYDPESLPVLHDSLAWLTTVDRFVLVRAEAGGYRASDARVMATFWMPLRYAWVVCGLFATVMTIAISGAAFFVFLLAAFVTR